VKTLATEYKVINHKEVSGVSEIQTNEFIEVKDKIQFRLGYNKSTKEIVVEEDYNNNGRSFEVWFRANVLLTLDDDRKIVSYNSTSRDVTNSDLRLLTNGSRLNYIIKKVDLSKDVIGASEAEVILKDAGINHHVCNNEVYLLGAKEDVCYIYNLLFIKINKLNQLKAVDEEINKQKENYLKLQKILQSNSKLIFNFPNKYLDAINKYIQTLTQQDNNISCFINDEPNEVDTFTLIIYGNNINKEYYYKKFDLKQDSLSFEPDLYATIVKTANVDSIRNLMDKSKVVRLT
jgi:hypothetical protein